MPLGIAVWGIGAHAQRSVLPAIAASPDVRLIGIHTRNPLVLEEQSKVYACRGWLTAEQMLADPEIDVVYLATPTSLHVQHGRQVLKSGKHLWCEKPLSTSLPEAEALIEVTRTTGLSLAVICGPRYHPQFFALREQIVQGAVGQPKRIEAAFHFPHVAPDNFRYNPDLGGGALLDVGFYLLTVVEALVPARLTQLSCQLETETGYRVDTSGKAQLQFEGGLHADLSWGYGKAYQNSLRVAGNKAELIAGPFFSKPQNLPPFIRLISENGHRREIDFENKNQFIEMFRAFSRGIPDKKIRLQLIADADRSQKLINAAMESASKQMKDILFL